MRHPATNTVLDVERVPTTFRVLGRGSRTAKSDTAVTFAGRREPQAVVAIDRLGVELWRREWNASENEHIPRETEEAAGSPDGLRSGVRAR